MHHCLIQWILWNWCQPDFLLFVGDFSFCLEVWGILCLWSSGVQFRKHLYVEYSKSNFPGFQYWVFCFVLFVFVLFCFSFFGFFFTYRFSSSLLKKFSYIISSDTYSLRFAGFFVLETPDAIKCWLLLIFYIVIPYYSFSPGSF